MSHYSQHIADRAELMGVTHDTLAGPQNPIVRMEAETELEWLVLERSKELEGLARVEGRELFVAMTDMRERAWAWLDQHGWPDSLPIDDDEWDDEDDWREGRW